jgi:hypothetical protein
VSEYLKGIILSERSALSDQGPERKERRVEDAGNRMFIAYRT